jgi:hypothetical protein
MKKRCLVVGLIIAAILHAGAAYSDNDYSAILAPTLWGNTEISWTVADCPNVPFSLYWSGQGHWLAQPGSNMHLIVLAVRDDIWGTVTLGNRTWNANDTDISKDLTLGVWGLTPWLPGLIVMTGEKNLRELNETAFESARRVAGNYVNGTMSSYYQLITVMGVAYSCLVFEYHQDQTSVGQPQETYLAYDTATGLLVRGNTSYSFDTPYMLIIELSSIYLPASVLPIVVVGLSVGMLLVVVVYIRRWR